MAAVNTISPFEVQIVEINVNQNCVKTEKLINETILATDLDVVMLPNIHTKNKNVC